MANWEYWVAGISGLLALFAPFALDFRAENAALWTSIIVGVLMIGIAGYEVGLEHPEPPQ